jgi:hypothetical protein
MRGRVNMLTSSGLGRMVIAPLLNVPLEQLRASNARAFAVSVPTDPQWTRIVKRVGPPSFLVVAVRDYSRSRASAGAEIRTALNAKLGRKVGAWAEGSSIGFAAGQVVALASAITGGLFLWWGSTFAWGRPEPTA